MKSPESCSSGLFGALLVQTTSGGCPIVIPAAHFSLALGALAMHRSGLEAAFFQPAHDLVLGEADIRLDPRIRYKSALYIRINRLAVNLQHSPQTLSVLGITGLQLLQAC
jgi:hypothetical protein